MIVEASTASLAPASVRSTAFTTPISSTIPVNMYPHITVHLSFKDFINTDQNNHSEASAEVPITISQRLATLNASLSVQPKSARKAPKLETRAGYSRTDIDPHV
jgi:hypothetical protein